MFIKNKSAQLDSISASNASSNFACTSTAASSNLSNHSFAKLSLITVAAALILGSMSLVTEAKASTFNSHVASGQNILSREQIRDLTHKCESGHDTEACTTLGAHYATLAIDTNQDIEVNMKLAGFNLEKSCSSGNQQACDIWSKALGVYGTYYISERSPKIDYKLGARILKRGCELGDPFACAQLGTLYRDGKGETKDNAMALSLFASSCDYAQAKSEHVKKGDGNIGLGCYYQGQMLYTQASQKADATESDKSEAFKLFDIACNLNTPEACLDLANYHTQLNQGEQAIKYTKQACLAGNADVCLQNAMQLHLAGNDKDSNYFLDIACQMGNGDACTLFATNILSGIAIEQNAQTALEMLNKSCDVGNGLACTFLGQLYLTGGKDIPNYKTEINLNLANAYFGKACKLGIANGCSGAKQVHDAMKAQGK
ncbi:tetratricopeptide repeat protein [Anaerobiospirillum succiniciproducens]|uniref:tetratricopeptide repeat protein n=1 Tax=Anaerobiospirillum succiniciproducens TaxID=13335 RepID=UPI003F8A39D8